MLSFTEFLLESLSGKQQKRLLRHPNGAVKIEHPDAPVVFHDPEEKITVYHLKTPEACHEFGQGTSLCTNTKHKSFAQDYLNHGNVFMIHHDRRKTQHFVAHRGTQWGNETSLAEPGYQKARLKFSLWDHLQKIPHEHKNHQWVKPTEKEDHNGNH